MALTDKLTNIADAIRSKTNTTDKMTLDDMTIEIEKIVSDPILQDKSVTITENGTTNIVADEGYDGLGNVEVITNIEGATGKYAPRTILFTGHTGTDLDYEIENLDTSNLTSLNNMFSNIVNVKTALDLRNWNLKNVTSMNDFVYQSNFTGIDLSGVDLSSLQYFTQAFETNYSGALLTGKINLSDIKAPNITSTYAMFKYQYNITDIDLTNFNTSNVTNMSQMFYGCNSVVEIDLSSFDTSKVTNMQQMFASNGSKNSWKNLDLSSFDTSNVTNMSSMFANCTSLVNLNVSSWNTEKVTTMNAMFSQNYGCSTLDLSSFDTSNVTDMYGMFYGTNKIETLDISNFDFSKVTSYSNIFRGCGTSSSTGIPTVYVKDETAQQWILNLSTSNRPSTWTTDNVIIKS